MVRPCWLALIATLGGCNAILGIESFPPSDAVTPSLCTTSTECVDGIVEGTCECGICSYPDPACAITNRRWPLDATGNANTCVPAPTQVDARVFHTCITMTDGTAWCWGANLEGGLGAGQPVATDSALPVHIRTTEGLLVGDLVETRVGVSSTCARRSDGSVVCWGGNQFGQLGGDLAISLDARSVDPVVVKTKTGPLMGVTKLAVGFHHACASTGTAVYCWGNNSRGQVGQGAKVDSPIAVPVGLPPGTIGALAAGGEHTCATITSGDEGLTYCWGRTADGRLGNGVIADASEVVPQRVDVAPSSPLSRVRQLSTGNRHSCAVTHTPGGPYCWGHNDEGALGDGTSVARSFATPVRSVEGEPGLIAAGDKHSCATFGSDTWCWGSDLDGQLGNGIDERNALEPVRVIMNDRQLDLTAAFAHTCALGTDRRLRCWGANQRGELGTGTLASEPAPTEIPATAFCTR